MTKTNKNVAKAKKVVKKAKNMTKGTTKKKATKKEPVKCGNGKLRVNHGKIDENQSFSDWKDEKGIIWREYYYKGEFSGSIQISGTGKVVRNVSIAIKNGNPDHVYTTDILGYIPRIKKEFPQITERGLFEEARTRMIADVVQQITEMTEV